MDATVGALSLADGLPERTKLHVPVSLPHQDICVHSQTAMEYSSSAIDVDGIALAALRGPRCGQVRVVYLADRLADVSAATARQLKYRANV